MSEEVKTELAALLEHLQRDVDAIGPGFRNGFNAKLTIAELEMVLAAARRAEEAERQAVCGSGCDGVGCGERLHFERSAGETVDGGSNVAVRCLDCGTVLCTRCARKHFDSERRRETDTALRQCAEMADLADENALAATFLREHTPAISFGLAMTTGSDAQTVSEERRAEAFAAVKALGALLK